MSEISIDDEILRKAGVIYGQAHPGGILPNLIGLRAAITFVLSEKASQTEDTALGPWVYCASHLRAHRSGWCTVDNGNKVGLGEFRGTDQEQLVEANSKCRALGLKLYEDVKRE